MAYIARTSRRVGFRQLRIGKPKAAPLIGAGAGAIKQPKAALGPKAPKVNASIINQAKGPMAGKVPKAKVSTFGKLPRAGAPAGGGKKPGYFGKGQVF